MTLLTKENISVLHCSLFRLKYEPNAAFHWYYSVITDTQSDKRSVWIYFKRIFQARKWQKGWICQPLFQCFICSIHPCRPTEICDRRESRLCDCVNVFKTSKSLLYYLTVTMKLERAVPHLGTRTNNVPQQLYFFFGELTLADLHLEHI